MAPTERKIKKISVDHNLCIGSASCVIAAASVFELDNENKSVILRKGGVKNAGPLDRSALEDMGIDDAILREAAESCPTKAISLYDEDGKLIYPV